MQFDLPKEKSSIIKVIGVGGGGSNAVNHMFKKGIKGVNFVICNTDAQAMELSPVPNKVQLGPEITEGRGAGSIPDTGRKATEESVEDVREILSNMTRMAFVTAGMGGGTGTGGAPVVARIAREMGILTVGIVTMPFGFEGRRRLQQATAGLQELQKHVDTLIVISNDKLKEMYGNLRLSEAFSHADDVLATAAKGIAEIITVPGYVNVDFEDVRTVMASSGVAIMGSAMASGEHRAMKAVSAALASPLLNDNDIRGAQNILLNITSGTEEVLMSEISEITDYVQEQAGDGTDIIWGNCYDESIGEQLSVTLIATGFEKDQLSKEIMQPRELPKVVIPFDTAKSQVIRPEPERNAQVEETEPVNEGSRQQITFDFEVSQQPKKKTTPAVGDARRKNAEPPKRPEPEMDDDRERQQLERIRKLRKMSLQLNNPNHLEEVENTPAFKRKDVDLLDVPASDEGDMSHYSVHRDEDGVEVRKNNSFLHDNVD
jgi:cell division protein FtsZ